MKQLSCSHCLYETRFMYQFLKHLSEVHENTANFSIRCGIDGCLNSYSLVSSLRKHMQRKHNQKIKPVNVDDYDFDEPYQNENEDSQIEDEIKIEKTDTEKALNEIAVFLLNMKEKHLITEKTCANIVTKFEDLLSRCLDETEKVLLEDDILLSDDQKSRILKPLTLFRDSLTSTNTPYKQKILFQKYGYIAPKEILLGGEDKVMYVPIIETLKQLVQKDDILSLILNPPNVQEGLFDSFASGDLMKKNEFLSKTNCLQIELYIDDFQIVNALGNKTKKHKICALYWSLGNIPSHMRSKLYTIQLLALTNSENTKKYGFKTVLKQFLEDMKTLETEGFSVTVDNQHFHFFATVSVVIADNLAAHEIGGWNESFSGFRICRFCNCTKDQKQFFSENKFELRNKKSHTEILKLVEEDPALCTVYGVRKPSCLNELEHFDIVWGSPSDIYHDIFEGFGVDVVKTVVEHCISAKYFTLDYLNERIENFPYDGAHSKNKPVKLSMSGGKLSVKQTAAESQALIRLLPLFVGHRVPEEDKHWINYTDFLEVLDFVLAPSLTGGQILYMEGIISEFLEDFFLLNPMLNIRPKAQFLIRSFDKNGNPPI